MKPLPFLREMGCVDDALPDACARRRAAGFKAAAGRLVRLSPAPAAAARPDKPNPDTGRGAVRRPQAAVHGARQAARQARLRIGRTFHLTEFGYQTSPPDPAVGHRADACRRATCSRPPTSRGSTSASAGSPSTSGTTSRSSTAAAAPSATRAGRPACASTTAQPKPVLSTMPGAVRDRPAARAQVRAAVGPGPPGRRAEVERADPAARRGRLPRRLTTVRHAAATASGRTARRSRPARSTATAGRRSRRWPTRCPLPRESRDRRPRPPRDSPYKASLAQ